MDHSLSNLVIQLDPANFNSAAYFDFLYFELDLTISFQARIQDFEMGGEFL